MNFNLNPAEFEGTNEEKKAKKITNLRKTLKKRREQRQNARETTAQYDLQTVTNNLTQSSHDDDDSDLADFNPPPRPVVQSNQPVQVAMHSRDNGEPSNEVIDGFVTYEDFNTQEAYAGATSNYVPYYNNTSNTEQLHGRQDELLDKLNYMIHLLEEQQDEKTGNVTEELILYSFLGVFVIFVVDSFARVGKYVR